MTTKSPHEYASRTAADIQEANPADPNFKAKSVTKKPAKTHGAIGGTESDRGKKSALAGFANKLTGKGVDVAAGPKGLGDKLRKLAKVRGTKTSY